jgi:hypothetical protein
MVIDPEIRVIVNDFIGTFEAIKGRLPQKDEVREYLMFLIETGDIGVIEQPTDVN